MRLSLRWAGRCQAAFGEPRGRALFAIVQGGADERLRVESARTLGAMGFRGYAIGGLAVGEPQEVMLAMIEAVEPHLPADRPRYLMGVGDPIGIVEAVARGVDMFDCVLPTRLARHGTALTSAGRFQVKNATHILSEEPLDPSCACSTCRRYARGYLRHLIQVGEPSAARLLTIHNLAWLLELMARIRAAIVDGSFAALRAEVVDTWEPAATN